MHGKVFSVCEGLQLMQVKGTPSHCCHLFIQEEARTQECSSSYKSILLGDAQLHSEQKTSQSLDQTFCHKWHLCFVGIFSLLALIRVTISRYDLEISENYNRSRVWRSVPLLGGETPACRKELYSIIPMSFSCPNPNLPRLHLIFPSWA